MTELCIVLGLLCIGLAWAQAPVCSELGTSISQWSYVSSGDNTTADIYMNTEDYWIGSSAFYAETRNVNKFQAKLSLGTLSTVGYDSLLFYVKATKYTRDLVYTINSPQVIIADSVGRTRTVTPTTHLFTGNWVRIQFKLNDTTANFTAQTSSDLFDPSVISNITFGTYNGRHKYPKLQFTIDGITLVNSSAACSFPCRCAPFGTCNEQFFNCSCTADYTGAKCELCAGKRIRNPQGLCVSRNDPSLLVTCVERAAAISQWSFTSEGNYASSVSMQASPGYLGGKALITTTVSPFAYSVSANLLNLSTSGSDSIFFYVKAVHTEEFQINSPVITIFDQQGRSQEISPNVQLLTRDWVRVQVNLFKPTPGFTITATQTGYNPVAISKIKLAADAWGGSQYSFYVDGLALSNSTFPCNFPCPCTGNRACASPDYHTCMCKLGYTGQNCEVCANEFVNVSGKCVLPNDGKPYPFWPNARSYANSDAWLAVHHDIIQVMRPTVLVLDFANNGLYTNKSKTLVSRIIDGFAEGSRSKGFEPNSTSTPQLVYNSIYVDLRDGMNGRPQPPKGYPYLNSQQFPRTRVNGKLFFNYSEFYTPKFAKYYGFVKNQTADTYYNLCELVNRGTIHEVWIIVSGETSDANAAEVLEDKPYYNALRQKNTASPLFSRCAGNGCFEDDVPYCGRSLRIGTINIQRGPGCYIHSNGHGMEQTAAHNVIPSLSKWFLPFARFDLGEKYGLPYRDWYAAPACTGPSMPTVDPSITDPKILQCVAYTSTSSIVFYTKGPPNYSPINVTITNYDPGCGSVHFTPTYRFEYEDSGPDSILSSCVNMFDSDELALVHSSHWRPYDLKYPDCGGGFLTWWYQNMPAYGSAHRYPDDNTRILSTNVYRFY